MLAIFQMSGKSPALKDVVNNRDKGNANDEANRLKNTAGRPSGPLDVLGLSCLR
jgi:hypothetical protein